MSESARVSAAQLALVVHIPGESCSLETAHDTAAPECEVMMVEGSNSEKIKSSNAGVTEESIVWLGGIGRRQGCACEWERMNGDPRT